VIYIGTCLFINSGWYASGRIPRPWSQFFCDAGADVSKPQDEDCCVDVVGVVFKNPPGLRFAACALAHEFCSSFASNASMALLPLLLLGIMFCSRGNTYVSAAPLPVIHSTYKVQDVDLCSCWGHLQPPLHSIHAWSTARAPALFFCEPRTANVLFLRGVCTVVLNGRPAGGPQGQIACRFSVLFLLNLKIWNLKVLLVYRGDQSRERP